MSRGGGGGGGGSGGGGGGGGHHKCDLSFFPHRMTKEFFLAFWAELKDMVTAAVRDAW